MIYLIILGIILSLVAIGLSVSLIKKPKDSKKFLLAVITGMASILSYAIAFFPPIEWQPPLTSSFPTEETSSQPSPTPPSPSVEQSSSSERIRKPENVKPIEPDKIDLDSIIFTSVGKSAGPSASWDFGEGVLYIYGTGNMWDCSVTSKALWYDMRNQIISVVISEGITKIGDESFQDCVKLEYIEIPSSVRGIGSHAFRNCKSIRKLVIPETVVTIGHSAFYDCIYLEELFIPEGVSEIGPYAFSNCTSLTKVIFPKSVSEISRWAFEGCSKLKEIYIMSKIVSIDQTSFKDTSSDLVIYCYENSTASTYAQNKKIQYKYYYEP